MLAGERPVRRIGFGAMRITGAHVWGPPADWREAIAVLRRAIDLGVDFIDTAESYGPGVSEELIAEALHPYPPGLVIATKGGLDRPGPEQWKTNARPERLRQAVEGSLRRLRLERLELYQLHRIDDSVPEAEQFGALRQLQQEGKIRHLGLSEVTVAQIERARQVFTVASVQNRYNLRDRAWDRVVDHCGRENIAFIPWAPIQIGSAARSRTLLEVAARHHATPSQIALAWLVRRAPVILPIPGTARLAHLDENCRAGDIALTSAEMERLGEAVGSGNPLARGVASLRRLISGS